MIHKILEYKIKQFASYYIIIIVTNLSLLLKRTKITSKVL